jgi:hypothetical protein
MENDQTGFYTTSEQLHEYDNKPNLIERPFFINNTLIDQFRYANFPENNNIISKDEYTNFPNNPPINNYIQYNYI